MWRPVLLPWPNNIGNTFEWTALRTSTTEIFVCNDSVLSRIYRLGEKSRVSEGHELPSGIRGHAPRKIFEMNMESGAIWDTISRNATVVFYLFFLIVIMFLVIYGLIAAAIGALSMLMSEPTAESYVKRTCMFVLSIATFTFTFI